MQPQVGSTSQDPIWLPLLAHKLRPLPTHRKDGDIRYIIDAKDRDGLRLWRGTVSFFDNVTLLGTSAVSGGVATLTTSFTSGSHPITAVYNGDGIYASSTSPVVTQTVTSAQTTTVLASSANPSIVGNPVTFTASVTSGAPGSITGTVTFFDNGLSIGSGTVSAGIATFTTSSLTGDPSDIGTGIHLITASYGGGGGFLPSTSNVINQVVKGPWFLEKVNDTGIFALKSVSDAGTFALKIVTDPGSFTQKILTDAGAWTLAVTDDDDDNPWTLKPNPPS
jgi:Bacterial Ig-like domain (group 3)